MPVVLLPGLEAVAAAVIALLLVLAIAYGLKWVASSMPGHGVPILGRLYSFVIAAAGRVLSAVGAEFDQVLGVLGRVVAYPVAVAQGLIGHVGDVLAEIADTTGWILGTAIPHAVGALAKHVEYLIHVARTYASHLVRQLAANVWKGIHGAEHLARSLVAGAVTKLGYLIHVARTYAKHLVGGLAAVVAADLVKAKDFTRAYVSQAVKSINQTIGDVDGKIKAGVSTAEAYAAASTATLAKTIPATVTGIAGGLITDIDQDIVTDLSGAWPTVKDDIGAIGQVVGQGWGDIRSWLDQLDLSKVTDIAGVAAATGVLSNVLTRYLRDCGAPNCTNLSTFGRDLQALLGLVEDGAILALFADLAFRPAEAAGDVQAILGGLATGTMNAAKDLLEAV